MKIKRLSQADDSQQTFLYRSAVYIPLHESGTKNSKEEIPRCSYSFRKAEENAKEETKKPARKPTQHSNDDTWVSQEQNNAEIRVTVIEPEKHARSSVKGLQPIPLRNIQKITKQHTFLINYVLEKAEKNETFACNYAHFHIPSLYLAAAMLSTYSSNQKKTSYFQILQHCSQKLSKIRSLKPPQLSEEVILEAVTNCLQYSKHRDDSGHFLLKLQLFIRQHEREMSSLMPLFLSYFKAIVQFSDIFVAKPLIFQMTAHLQKMEGQVRQKYPNFDK